MDITEYSKLLKRFNELKDIDDSDDRVDEFNELYDKIELYENEHNIYTTRE